MNKNSNKKNYYCHIKCHDREHTIPFATSILSFEDKKYSEKERGTYFSFDTLSLACRLVPSLYIQYGSDNSFTFDCNKQDKGYKEKEDEEREYEEDEKEENADDGKNEEHKNNN